MKIFILPKKIKNVFTNTGNLLLLNFSRKSFLNKKTFPVFFVLIAAGLFFVAGTAHAGIGEEVLDVVLNYLIFPLLYVIFWILFSIAYVVAQIGATIISINLNPSIISAVLKHDAVYQGWIIFRDVANLLFILILLIVALGTIFRSETYNIKKSLYKFILVIFLINFSFMIAGIFIDFGNMLMYGILKIMCSGGDSACLQDFYRQMMGSIDTLNKYYTLDTFVGVSAQGAIGMAIATLYTFFYGLILMALGLFLMVRIAVLAVLLILAPLAFFGYIAPGLESLKNKWWDNLVQYVMFGPVFALMLYVTSLMMTITISVPEAAITANPNMGPYATTISTIIVNIIPLIFLLGIIPVTRTFGIAGTNAIMGATVLAGGAALTGAAKFAGSYASDSVGRFVARGAQREGGGAYNKFRRGLSNLSPTALKQAYKAKKADEQHDYDVATGRMRNKLEQPGTSIRDPFRKNKGDRRVNYEIEARERKASEKIKSEGIDNAGDMIDKVNEGLKKGEDKETLVRRIKFIAAEGGMDDLLDRTLDTQGNQVYGKGPAGMINYIKERHGDLSDEGKAKLLMTISKSEKKNGNVSYEGLGESGYNNTEKKIVYRVNEAGSTVEYKDPKTGGAVPNPITNANYTQAEMQIENQVKAGNKMDPKDIKKGSFLDKNNIIHSAGEQIFQNIGEGKRADRIKMMDRDRAVALNDGLKKKYAALFQVNPNNLFMTDPNNTSNKIINPTWAVPHKTQVAWNILLADHHLS